MMRILVLGQPGSFGQAWCQRASARLARRLDLPCFSAQEGVPDAAARSGWVVAAPIGALSEELLGAADTAVWLHYSPLPLARAWLAGLIKRLFGTEAAGLAPRLSDVLDSVLHMAWTPHLHQLLHHPEQAHLQIFHLRSPDETDFWLRMQDHRAPARRPPLAQAA